MSTSRTYLRPGGLIWGKAAADAAAAGLAGLIAGGDTGFTAVEVITRDGLAISRQWRAYSDIAASSDSAIEERLDLIVSGRPEMTALGLDGSCLMGIVNVTPDSFSDGGLFADAATGIAHGRKLAEAGATMLDVGGESTRPYSRATAEAEERARALPVVKALAAEGFKVSIDTRKPAIMRDALAAGAILINDVAALSYAPDSVETARDLGVPVVLMHAQGTPETMQDDPRYEDVVLDIFDWLQARLTACVEAGIAPGRIFLDPGIGFGKTHAHNLELLGSLTLFHGLGRALVVGASRKGFIGKLTGEAEARSRVAGSLGAALASLMQGVQIVRVHDVAETRQAAAVWHASMATQSMDLDGRFTTAVLKSYGP